MVYFALEFEFNMDGEMLDALRANFFLLVFVRLASLSKQIRAQFSISMRSQ